MGKSEKDKKQRQLFSIIESKDNESNRKYFFEQITKKADATWLPILKNKGYFKKSPELFPMNYLVSVASVKSDLVAKIISKIPTIDNPRICDTMMEIAAQLPPKQSMAIKAKVLKYVSKSSSLWGEEAAKLLIYWSENKQSAAALELLQKLVGFSPDPEDKEKRKRRKGYNEQLGHMEKVRLLVSTGLEPKHRMDVYFYREMMNKAVPQLIEKEPYKSAAILIKATSKMIRLKSHNDGMNYFDWDIQSSIGGEQQDEQQKGHERTQIDTMILACEKVYEKQQDKIAELDKILCDEKMPFFENLRLRLFAKYPSEATKPWIREFILKYDGYGKDPFDHDFYNMTESACKQFGEEFLTVEERTKIFATINSVSFSDDNSRSYTENDLRRTQFYPFERVLFGKYKDIFQRLKNMPIKNKEHPHYHTPNETERRSIHDHSPYSYDKLASFSDSELFDRINNWSDEKQFIKDDRIVAINRVGFAAMLFDVFKDLIACDRKRMAFWLKNCDRIEHSVYLREIVFAMHEQVKTEKYDMLDVYLEVSKRVLIYSDEMWRKEKSRELHSRDPGWSSPRWAVCKLVSSYLERQVESLSSVWNSIQSILMMLCTQYDRELDEEKQKSTIRHDPLHEGINTIRGRSLIVLCNFAITAYKCEASSNLSAAQQIIKQRLDSQTEYVLQPEEHAILGMNYLRLHAIDKHWTSLHRKNIFPQDKPNACAAALGALVGYNKPCKLMFEVVRDNFNFIMQHLDKFRSKDTYGKSLLHPLEIQLFSFYLAGEYSLTGKDSLLDQYYTNTAYDKKNRGELLYTVGDNLRNENDKFSKDELKKILDFFKKRVEDGDFVEMGDFNPWLDVQQLSIKERLNACIKVLDTCELKNFSIYNWLKKFCKMLPDHTAEVVKCFEKLVCRDNVKIFHINKDQVKTIVAAGRNSNTDTQRHTDRAVDCLLKKSLINVDDLNSCNDVTLS